MLINKLRLKNFKQYQNETINFPMGLTGLVGRNGAGKSTIFDAITFALFGPLKGVNLPLLKNDYAGGSDSVEVELEFEEKRNLYIVKRSLKGINATSKVELFRVELDGDSPKLIPLAQLASTVSDEIYKIIRLDRESFINSFFARQKETAGLLASSPREREVEIRKMLGFDRLDTISKKVGDKIKVFKYEIEADSKNLFSEEKISELNNQINVKKVELKKLSDEHKRLKQIVASKLSEIVSQEKKVDDLKKTQKAYNSLEKEITSIRTSIAKTEESISSTRNEISRLENLKTESEKLSSVVELLRTLKSTHAEMQIKKDNSTRYSSILSDKRDAENSLVEFERQISILTDSIKKNERTPETFQLKTDIKEGLEREVEQLNSNALDLGREIAGNEAVLNEMVERLQHVEGLDETGPCPECERELGSQKPVLIDKYKNGITKLEKVIAEVTSRKVTVLGKLELKRKELKSCGDEIIELGKIIVQLNNDNNQLKNLSEQLVKTGEKIGSAERDLLAVGARDFDSESFQNLGKEIIEAEKQNDVYQKMLGEIGTLPNQQEHLTVYLSTLTESQAKLLVKDTDLVNLNFNADELTTSESLLKQKRDEHLQLNEETHTVELNLNTIKNDLTFAEKTLLEDAEKKETFVKKQKELEKYKIFKEIIDNFKSRITSEAIPKISQEANQLFGEITKERYNSLRIDKESFEIKVMRDEKEALIETLSGGEKDLAAVCLRIAISRHIIDMSGAGNMGFLALDEVFGSQDEGRRAELMFALAKISDWFKQVFIVAHNQDVEEAFPNRMIISKKGMYSSIDCQFNTTV